MKYLPTRSSPGFTEKSISQNRIVVISWTSNTLSWAKTTSSGASWHPESMQFCWMYEMRNDLARHFIVNAAQFSQQLQTQDKYLRQRSSFSSDLSAQSGSPSQTKVRLLHSPFSQVNWSFVQLLDKATHLFSLIIFMSAGHAHTRFPFLTIQLWLQPPLSKHGDAEPGKCTTKK